MTSYGWTDPRVLMPDHVYMTQDISQSTGLNIRFRQPLPFFSGMGGRLEATAELRNMLAQGYLPLDMASRKALLTNSPAWYAAVWPSFSKAVAAACSSALITPRIGLSTRL